MRARFADPPSLLRTNRARNEGSPTKRHRRPDRQLRAAGDPKHTRPAVKAARQMRACDQPTRPEPNRVSTRRSRAPLDQSQMIGCAKARAPRLAALSDKLCSQLPASQPACPTARSVRATKLHFPALQFRAWLRLPSRTGAQTPRACIELMIQGKPVPRVNAGIATIRPTKSNALLSRRRA